MIVRVANANGSRLLIKSLNQCSRLSSDASEEFRIGDGGRDANISSRMLELRNTDLGPEQPENETQVMNIKRQQVK